MALVARGTVLLGSQGDGSIGLCSQGDGSIGFGGQGDGSPGRFCGMRLGGTVHIAAWSMVVMASILKFFKIFGATTTRQAIYDH